MTSGGCNPEFIVRNKPSENSNPKYKSSMEVRSEVSGKTNYIDFNILTDLFLSDDVKIEFSHVGTFGKTKMFHFWFNTSFIDRKGIISITKEQIDRKKKTKFDSHFMIELHVDTV